MLLGWHQFDKYNLFIYAIIFYIISGFLLFYGDLDKEYMEIIVYFGLFIQGFGMANMMNSATSLVSEMIGQDDEASAIVFACFNILESFSNGTVVYVLTAYGFVNDAGSMKFCLAIIPILCAIGAYTVSWARFRNRAEQQFASRNPDIPEEAYRSRVSRSSSPSPAAKNKLKRKDTWRSLT